jgi:hypothetical protein
MRHDAPVAQQGGGSPVLECSEACQAHCHPHYCSSSSGLTSVVRHRTWAPWLESPPRVRYQCWDRAAALGTCIVCLHPHLRHLHLHHHFCPPVLLHQIPAQIQQFKTLNNTTLVTVLASIMTQQLLHKARVTVSVTCQSGL